jgi:hypothetical protein
VFKVTAVNSTGRPQAISASEGLVLEAVRRAAPPRTPRRPGTGRATKTLEGYCLEFAKDPPPADTLYRVASPATQKRFAPIRDVLRAAARLAADGLLQADGDLARYTEFIKQYAVWSRLEHWTPAKFAEAFLERTKRNFAAAKQPWTREVEQTVRNATPGRWADIQRVLSAVPGR